MTSSDWATQQLAEFLAVLTTAADENIAVANALERLAESFDADGGAFVRGRHVVSSLGWSTGHPHEAEILAVALGHRANVEIPGAGMCETVVIPVDRDEGSKVVLARACYRFSAEEGALLRGMGRVLALALRLLRTVAVERRQADENAKLVASLRERQALLERLSSIQRQISSRALLPEVLDAVTAGVAEFLGDDVVVMQLVDESDPAFTVTTSSAGLAAHPEVGFDRRTCLVPHAGMGSRRSARRWPCRSGCRAALQAAWWLLRTTPSAGTASMSATSLPPSPSTPASH